MVKRKLTWKKVVICIMMLIFIIGLIYSTFNIVKWNLENNKTEEMQKIIDEKVIIDDNPSKKESILDEYSINFAELKKINSEVVGYIKVENTNINSTIVKHKDNSFYLNHSFDKSRNSAGWIFSHYKNKYDGTDKNYVLFGHARKDGSMFGTLKKVLSKNWQNTNSKVIFITENSKNIYEVFSVYKIRAEEYYIQTDFKNNKEFGNFINKIKGRSIKKFNVDVKTDDQILTLSTCDSNNNQYRVVLHAKKIKEN